MPRPWDNRRLKTFVEEIETLMVADGIEPGKKTIVPAVNGWASFALIVPAVNRWVMGSPGVYAGVEGSIQSHHPSGKRLG